MSLAACITVATQWGLIRGLAKGVVHSAGSLAYLQTRRLLCNCIQASNSGNPWICSSPLCEAVAHISHLPSTLHCIASTSLHNLGVRTPRCVSDNNTLKCKHHACTGYVIIPTICMNSYAVSEADRLNHLPARMRSRPAMTQCACCTDCGRPYPGSVTTILPTPRPLATNRSTQLSGVGLHALLQSHFLVVAGE